MAPRGSKSLSWCFTSFKAYDNGSLIEPEMEYGKLGYLVYGTETCPHTARKHLQGFVQFKKRQYLSGVKAWFPGAHFERCRGTAEENRTYCIKDGDFKEFGVIRISGNGGSKFAEVLSAAKENRIQSIQDEYPGIYLRYKTTLEALRSYDTTELKSSCGYWFYGPPRTGKDYAVTSVYKGNLYSKMLNKWWDGYNGEENVLISDVDSFSVSFLGYYLKIWTDRYAFNAEIKGGTIKIRPKRIFCTSNYRIEELFSGPVLSALQCRFEIYNYDAGRVDVVARPVIKVNDAFRKVLVGRNGLEETVEKEKKEAISETWPVAGPSGIQIVSSDEEDFQVLPKKRVLSKNV